MGKLPSLLKALLAIGVLITAAQANAFTITQTSNQSVNGAVITACADVGGASFAPGTPVGPYPCNNQFNQQWIWSNGQLFGLGTANGAGNCLYAGVADPNPVAVVMSTCSNSVITNPSVDWEIVSGKILNGNNSVIGCLDSQGQIGAGLQLVVNNCNNSASQTWSLKGVTITQTSAQTVNGGTITVCADVGGAATANGTPVGPYPCNNQLNEQWMLSNGQFIGLGTANATSECLSVKGNSTEPGALVELDTCKNGNSFQLWTVLGVSSSSGSPSGVIISSGNGFCLDSRGQAGAGLQLAVNPCGDNLPAGQAWTLK